MLSKPKRRKCTTWDDACIVYKLGLQGIFKLLSLNEVIETIKLFKEITLSILTRYFFL